MTAARRRRGGFFFCGSGPEGSSWRHAKRDKHWVQLPHDMWPQVPGVQKVPSGSSFQWPKFPVAQVPVAQVHTAHKICPYTKDE